jgi:hypothetical protein
VCGDKDKFMEFDEAIRDTVTFKDHSKVAIKGKCMILMKLKDGTHQFIGDIYYIPTMKKQYIDLMTIVGEGV